MPEPLVITIAHRLGRAEAKRRLAAGLAQIHAELAAFTSAFDHEWTEYRLDFTVAAMRQTIRGHADIEDDIVRIELGLPLLLRVLGGAIAARVRGEGALLLNK